MNNPKENIQVQQKQRISINHLGIFEHNYQYFQYIYIDYVKGSKIMMKN